MKNENIWKSIQAICAAQQKTDQQYLGNLIGKHFTHWWD
jgi:hypothetical protein